MTEKIIEEKQSTQVNEESYLRMAEEFNMNLDDFKVCLEEEKYLDKIEKQLKEAQILGINGVPTIFVNNIILPGAYPFEDFTDSSGQDRKGLESIILGEMEN
jgi:protein-disulfide isomerase